MSLLETQPVFALLQRALDVAALKQAVHTTNIANADVQGYRRLEVQFDSELEQATALATPNETAPSRESEAPTPARVVVAADDTVRLDREMALMAKDALHYQMLLGAVDRTSSLLRLAINEGKGG